MKKRIALFTCALYLLTFWGGTANVSALTSEVSTLSNEGKTSVSVEYINKNERIETIISEEPQQSSGLYAARGAVITTAGTKTVNYYNGDRILWSVSVRGTFAYGNGYVNALSSTTSSYSNDSNWSVTNTGNSFTGNTAIGSAVGRRYFIFIVVQTINREVRLSCDANGRLS